MATIDVTSNLSTTLYYLLYAKYGNSSIASADEEQFKKKVFATIYMYAPAWRMRLKIQEKLMNLDPDDKGIIEGTIMYYNKADNPDTAPATDSFSTLPGINSQTTSNVKRGKLEGYAMLAALINTDVTEEFLGRFKKFFLQVVSPSEPLWYPGIDNENMADINYVNSDADLFGNYKTKTFSEIWERAEDFVEDYKTENSGFPQTI